MKTISAILACVLLAATCVASLPVIPEASLEMMKLMDACLYACNICFDNKEGPMMTCANRACMAGELGLAWLAENCEGHPHPFIRQFLKYALSSKKH